MRFALILITIALMLVVGFSWVPAENVGTKMQPDAVEDSVLGPVYYDTIPVEHIEFEPLHVNVHYVSLDTWEDEKHSEIY